MIGVKIKSPAIKAFQFTGDFCPMTNSERGYVGAIVTCDSRWTCSHRDCDEPLDDHGLTRSGVVVCPGDWLIKDASGRVHVCRDGLFSLIFEPEGAGR